MAWVRPAALGILALAGSFLSSCGSTERALDSTIDVVDAAGVHAATPLDALRLESMSAPPGVTSTVWRQLTVELVRVLAVAEIRTVSSPPTTGATARLSFNAGEGVLTWGYACAGDYNQDGEIGIGDLTPLGLHFGELSPDGVGQPFPWDSIGAVVDGDGNGQIGITDVTPIGANFGRRIQGYHVYRSFDSADYPATPDAGNGPGAKTLGTVMLTQATGAAAAGRKQFSLPLTDPQPGAYYWVRPYDGEVVGTPSNLVAGAEANLPPLAAIAADPPAGPVPLTV